MREEVKGSGLETGFPHCGAGWLRRRARGLSDPMRSWPPGKIDFFRLRAGERASEASDSLKSSQASYHARIYMGEELKYCLCS